MENNYFDKLFRDKLENLEASDRAGSWELLQHRMAADPELSTPGEVSDPIDEIIKSKLQDTTASYEPGFWAMMENKIDADVDLNPQLDDVAFDGIAYENLNNLQTPYNPSHWELMAKRIQEEFSLRHRLYKYKVAEVGLMLLAIFTLLQFLPIDKINMVKNNAVANETEVQYEIQQAVPSTDINKTANANNKTQVDNIVSSKTIVTSPIGPIPVPSLLAEATTTSKTKSAAETETTLPDYTKLNNIGTSVTPPVENALPLVTTKSIVSHQETNNTTGLDNQNTTSIVVENENLSITDMLEINSSEMDLLTADNSENLPQCVLCKRKKPVYIKAGMLIASNLNYIMTPYDEKFEQDAYATLSAGYTGGISLSVQKGRLEIGSAIHYSSIRYAPKQNVEYSGSVKDGLIGDVELKSAQLNVISIPLNVNYTYAHVGRWNLYALGGGSANIAIINHFDTKKFVLGGGASRGNGDPRRVNPHPEPTPNYNGVFEGGSLNDNLYFTVNLGLGAERYFSPRWSVFVQPVYQHSIFAKGLGPNTDRFNTFSIFAGAKATLR